MVTIRDVAKKAEVHFSTVSRVLSGNPRISPETTERVIKAAQELGYHPNSSARSLSRNRTSTIGIVVPFIYDGFFEDIFFPRIMQGLLIAADKFGYRILVGGSKGYTDEIDQINEIMGSRQADGIIVMSSRLDVDTVQVLSNHHTPFVLLGRPPIDNRNEIAWVDADNANATLTALKHLIELGHKDIAFIGGDPNHYVTQQREDAYRSAHQEIGLPINPDWIHYGYFSSEGGYKAIKAIYEKNSQYPTAYYAANDMMAFGIMEYLKQKNIEVPRDVSIIGTNDSPNAMFSTPQLSSIYVPYAKMAASAVTILNDIIDNGIVLAKQPHQVKFPCTLNIRESTTRPSVA